MEAIYTIEQLRERLNPVFLKNNVRRATLFGSYSRGAATPGSDVDILVDSGLKGLAFYGLLEDASRALDCPLDLIDTREVVPGSLVDREIRRTGVVIYER